MKNIGNLLITVLIAGFIPIAIYGAAVATEHSYNSGDKVFNGNYVVNHKYLKTNTKGETLFITNIARDSSITYTKTNETFMVSEESVKEDSQSQMGSFRVKNNSIEGYKLEIKSTEGFLKRNESDANDNYESNNKNIEYKVIVKVRPGYKGNVPTTKIEKNSSNMNQFQTVVTGIDQTEGTDATFDIYINVEEKDIWKTKMGGTYNDVITFRYTENN